MQPTVVPSALDQAVDSAIAAVNAQVAAAEALIQQTAAPSEPEASAAPAAPPPADVTAVTTVASLTAGDAVTIKGVLVTPETHLYENGVPLLTPTGRPRLKPEARKTKAPPSESIRVYPSGKAARAEPVALTDSGVIGVPAATPPAPAAAPAPIPQTVKPTTATVTTVYGKIGLPATKDEEIAVRTFVSTPAMVEIGYGLTLNIGNYESARIDVRISLPCYPEEADGAFSFAKKWTEERIQTEVKAIRQIASGTKSNTPF
jgi:hypothetical protein